MFFICKKQITFVFLISVFILLKAVPCVAGVAAISPCQAEFIEEEQNAEENRLLNLAEKAEQLMEGAREMLDKIKNVEENKSLFFEEGIENNSSMPSELLSLEEIRSAKKFFSNTHQKFQKMANAFLNYATNTEHPGLPILENAFHNLENIFNRKSSYFERQIQELLSGTVGLQNGISNSAGSQKLLEDLMENPHLLQADTPYFVEFSNNQTSAFVIFDESVVDVFLEPRNRAFQFDLLRKNVSSIRKGFTSGSGSNGIKFLRNSRRRGAGRENKYKDIFEVKTLGRVTGNIRLGGFIDDQGNLHIVHYKNGSEHTINQWSNFLERIKLKRDLAERASHFGR